MASCVDGPFISVPAPIMAESFMVASFIAMSAGAALVDESDVV